MAYEGLLFRITDTLRWGIGKGSPLSALEVDENFYTLANKVKAIEDNPPTPVEIASFQVIGSQLKVFMNDGTEFGPFTLPTAQFVFRDEWQPDGYPYFELDVVSVIGRGLFLVRLDHDSAATFDPDATDGDGHPLYLKVFGEDTYKYTFGFFAPGTPGAGIPAEETMFAHLFADDVYMTADAGASLARLQVASDGDRVFTMYKNATEIGTLSFTGSVADGNFDIPAAVQFNAGDVFYMTSASALDATAKNLMVTINGYRGLIPAES